MWDMKESLSVPKNNFNTHLSHTKQIRNTFKTIILLNIHGLFIYTESFYSSIIVFLHNV